MKNTVAYFYYNFYPVTGGASVHGYNLAKELSRLGYRLLKLNGAPDPWTGKRKKSPFGLVGVLRESDLIYVRIDYFLKPRNLIGFVSILSGRKTVVELNAPSDELHLFGRGVKYIRWVDRIYAGVLRRASAVIVVSEGIRNYCKEALGLENVHLIENGGEVFDPEELKPDPALAERIDRLRQEADKLVIWAGSPNEMQELEWLNRIARQSEDGTAFLIVLSHSDEKGSFFPETDKLLTFTSLSRDDVGYLISQSDIGLAFYRPYEGSRWGIYNSSLKLFEYLNNGLLTLTNIEGTAIQRSSVRFRRVGTPEEAADQIRLYKTGSAGNTPVRTWADAAAETAKLFESILHE